MSNLSRRRSFQAFVFSLAAGLLLSVATTGTSQAGSFPAADDAPATASGQPPAAGATGVDVLAAKDRAAVIGAGWKSSKDLVWTTSGDAEGFHLLAAQASAGYAWRTAATLVEPGFDADAWIGNACLTGSGRRAVVVYAPRTFTNKPELMARGGFTAIVDLLTGRVRKLDLQASLSYYNPGCGAGESAVLTQSGGEDKSSTRLVRVDTVTGKLAKPIELEGQLTSSVPVQGGAIAAADGNQVVVISGTGVRTPVVATRSVPTRLTPDATGGLVFVDRSGQSGVVKRIESAAGARRRGKIPAAVLGEGPLTTLGISRAAAGQVYLTGELTQVAANLPSTVHRLSGTAKSARVSTTGAAVLTRSAWLDGKDTRGSGADARPASVELLVPSTGRRASFVVEPGAVVSPHAAEGSSVSPKLARASGPKVGTAGSPTNPVEDERVCAVPRNDPKNQAMQPKPRQVEWAVDQAVMGTLNQHISRPYDWKNLKMPAYQPQTLFPRPALLGGGTVPAQVMLGVAAQESNLWQASKHALPGVTSNPLIGNFYGLDYYDGTPANDWDVNWADADCGYGITQVTDHMRLAGKENGKPVAWPYETQRAVALDYTVNIAAGLQILIDKWNQTLGAGLVINNGKPQSLENWFFALWAYNSGFYPDQHNGSPWGVGWANNPANPEWDAGRFPFMDEYSDAAHPQDWPYQEKVLGFAGHPIEMPESPGVVVRGFIPAWWTNDTNKFRVKPAENTFCGPVNSCDPGKIGDGAANEIGAGPCTRSDYKCWWHESVTWKQCPSECGYENVRFNSTYPEQADALSYPPNCSLQPSNDLYSKGNGAPPGALIIDDQPDGTKPIRTGCGRPWTNAGSFSLTFTDAAGTYPGKIDTHQIGGGFGGHFYFSHTRKNDSEGARLRTTGTWTLNTVRNEWSRIVVHLPDHGAHTQQAKYEIDTGSGSFTKIRYLSQKRMANNWVSLGVYQLTGKPRVRLSTITDDGTGNEDVAWDAVAFQPLPAKPKHLFVALGDSYTSGEGAGGYYGETDADHGSSRWNGCRRSVNAWPRKVVLPGQTQSLGWQADNWDKNAELGFVACSGAKTANVADRPYSDGRNSYGMGQWGEQHQTRSGALDENTTLVMLTLGGNDGDGFSNALEECATPFRDCSVDPTFMTRYSAKIDQMAVNLKATLKDVRNKAPNAQVVLLGYPELLSTQQACVGAYTIEPVEARVLAQLSRLANSRQLSITLQLSTEGMKIAYNSPVDKFLGHAGCDSDAWINTLRIGPYGDGDFHAGDPASVFCTWAILGGDCLSMESFHPNGSGTTAYADVMMTRLRELGYSGR